ncbi:hypothetical protein DUNSADRAFT_11580 [Dunaliella salina]|uniref:Uncharacterized protein n=1 Tax=Dunaliella salina TaxID=3046 RepID=A0ABQ7GD13_DUNSA|nr:hypothetical protein DUNSADRAFT_11580 [Dunaliella salina]|eukprot:KAF5832508.1 hypothetical protein DUNSADRAFT_11580 [Dunaliella salina]
MTQGDVKMETLFCNAFRRMPPVATQSLNMEGQRCRVPLRDFRNTCLKKVVELVDDEGARRKYREDISRMALQLAGRDPDYENGLARLVSRKTEKFRTDVEAGLKEPTMPEEKKEQLRQKLRNRQEQVRLAIEGWCKSTAFGPHFQRLQPFLEKTIDLEPCQLDRDHRNGDKAELQFSSLFKQELPFGFSMRTSCAISEVEGKKYRDIRGQKGEIDAVIINADGVVQVAVEVKTAKGNPYTTLHSDLQKFQPMLDLVRGKVVTLTSASCQTAADVPHQTQTSTHTLPFSQDLRAVYILASSMAAFGPDMENAARRSILSQEINRELSKEIDAWGDIQIVELDPGSVHLRVEGNLLQECGERVDNFFRGLDGLDVFVLPSKGE